MDSMTNAIESMAMRNASVWHHCVQCFDIFGIGAIIDGRVLCVNGGLSPDIRAIDQIPAIDRQQEIPHEVSI